MIKMSEETSELFKAMSAFQSEVKQPKKDANNPFFKSKYVPLENVIDAIHTVGSKHGLSEMTYPSTSESGLEHGVGVIITHTSGQYIQFPPVMLKPEKNTPQGIGACLTYSRRYALSSAFGIASETDDDANEISGNTNKKPNNKPTPKTEIVSQAQATFLNKLVADVSEASNGVATVDGLLSKLNIKDMNKLQVDQYGTALNQLNKWKQAYQKNSVKKEAPAVEPEQESILDRYGNPK